MHEEDTSIQEQLSLKMEQRDDATFEEASSQLKIRSTAS
jgi:hypothetical protein